jgi:hypothetical protein
MLLDDYGMTLKLADYGMQLVLTEQGDWAIVPLAPCMLLTRQEIQQRLLDAVLAEPAKRADQESA